MPARPRASRRTNGERTDALLHDWERLVEAAEQGTASHTTGCPQCDGDDGLEARDRLDALVLRGGRRALRGGRRALRIARRLEGLDARFRAATTPAPFAGDGPGWWRRRNLD